MSEKPDNGAEKGPEENHKTDETPEKSAGEPAAELEAAKQELLYARADLENTRKRLVRDQEQAIRFANERLISELLSVMDLFELALSSSQSLRDRKDDKEIQNYLTGIEMTHRQFVQTLERMGAEMIGKVGEKFDPSKHEAVSQVAVQDAATVGTILKVLNRGCLLHGRLLKPAKVTVAEAT